MILLRGKNSNKQAQYYTPPSPLACSLLVPPTNEPKIRQFFPQPRVTVTKNKTN